MHNTPGAQPDPPDESGDGGGAAISPISASANSFKSVRAGQRRTTGSTAGAGIGGLGIGALDVFIGDKGQLAIRLNLHRRFLTPAEDLRGVFARRQPGEADFAIGIAGGDDG